MDKEVGKCFSACNQGQRKEGDFYETHYSMTEQLLEKYNFDIDKSFLEPACGNNAITKILSKRIKNIFSYDIINGENFLNEKRKFDWIITNPPYSLADKFVMKAKEVSNVGIAFLLRTNYLQGNKRYKLIFNVNDNFKLKYIYQFTRMADLSAPIREDGKYPTGMLAYCWMIWEKGFNGLPIIDWIDNQQYVLNKNNYYL